MKNKHQTLSVIKRIILFLGIYLCGHFSVLAQFTIRFDVYDPTQKAEIFLAGNFNNWNPGNTDYKLKDVDQTHKSITIKINSAGKYSFKFTRGNWGTVESTDAGFDIDDRVIEIHNDTTLQLKVAGWLDDYFDLSKFPDSIRTVAYWNRSFFFQEKNLDSSYKYAMEGFDLSKKNNDKKAIVSSLIILSQVFEKKGNPDRALELLFQALPIAEPLKDSFQLAGLYFGIGNIFKSENEYPKAKFYYQNVLRITSQYNVRGFILPRSLLRLGEIYFATSRIDSAAYYARKVNELFPSAGAYLLLGDIEKRSGNKKSAMLNYRQAVIQESKTTFSSADMAQSYQRIAQEFIEDSHTDSGLYYARMSLDIAKQVNNPFIIAAASSLLSKLFENEKKFDSAFFYQQISLKTNDSLFTMEKEKQIHNLVFNDQLHKQELAAEKAKLRSRAWIYGLLGGLAVLILTAALLIRNNKQKKKANTLLGKQKEQIEMTLADLKAAQSQLIQSEKMASLGELTAGIAHEIQNPLNFVNNFSEVNQELIEELKSKNEKLEIDDEEINELLDGIASNEEKINYHGKRADAIVKGMLQHSRTSSGQKEPSDINALADEYLRLAYHGFRAKDKAFNAEIKTDFDSAIGKINIVSQDIGRALLNLINNAFYAVSEKAKQNIDGYEPTVKVVTKRSADKVLISVSDNGNGIPKNIVDKIFQPFFTTKPTGQGTGLGLSLAYDIIKAHGGEIRVETKEGEGSDFIILLPIQIN